MPNARIGYACASLEAKPVIASSRSDSAVSYSSCSFWYASARLSEASAAAPYAEAIHSLREYSARGPTANENRTPPTDRYSEIFVTNSDTVYLDMSTGFLAENEKPSGISGSQEYM